MAAGIPTLDNGGLDDDETHSRICVGCRAVAPAAGTAYSLISAKHGWRLQRVESGGSFRFEWRCPPCWSQWKQRSASLP